MSEENVQIGPEIPAGLYGAWVWYVKKENGKYRGAMSSEFKAAIELFLGYQTSINPGLLEEADEPMADQLEEYREGWLDAIQVDGKSYATTSEVDDLVRQIEEYRENVLPLLTTIYTEVTDQDRFEI